MDRAVRTEPVIALQVTWAAPPDTDADGVALAWGHGILRVDGEPAWSMDGESLEWSWIELLEFLADKWPYLVTEQAYPANLAPEEPRNLRRELKKALESGYTEVEGDVLDEEVFRFEERHDFSRALRGIAVPSVFVLREGNEVWVTTDEQATRFPLAEVVRDLEALGNFIAQRIEPRRTTSPRVEDALNAWERRSTVSPALLVRLAKAVS